MLFSSILFTWDSDKYEPAVTSDGDIDFPFVHGINRVIGLFNYEKCSFAWLDLNIIFNGFNVRRILVSL
jgi:hypothetical protein